MICFDGEPNRPLFSSLLSALSKSPPSSIPPVTADLDAGHRDPNPVLPRCYLSIPFPLLFGLLVLSIFKLLVWACRSLAVVVLLGSSASASG